MFIEIESGITEGTIEIQGMDSAGDYTKFRCAEHSDDKPRTWFLLHVLERESIVLNELVAFKRECSSSGSGEGV